MTNRPSDRYTDLDQAIEALKRQPTITPDQTALVLGQSGVSIRAAIKRGDIQSFRMNRNIRVPSAPIRRMLGIEG